MCTYLSLRGGSDGVLFSFSLSFHRLYHHCAVTLQRGKMDSPSDASASLMLWFLQLLPLIQTTPLTLL